MKKLLTILTTVSLLTPTVNTIVSCSKEPKYIPDDDSNQTINDVETINKIKERVKKHFQAWWNAKSTIDITAYSDQVAKFEELVTSLKTNDGQVLVGTAISQYRFLDQLVTAFRVEFNNLNREIANEYSNFYLNTTPLALEANDIVFTLHHINFDNLAKLITVNNNSIMGITINFDIKYQVKFKDFEQDDKINWLVVICNDLEALSGIQKNLENYFLIFVDDLFEKQKYEIIDNLNRDFDTVNKNNTIWPIITQELTKRGVLFKTSPDWSYLSSTFGLVRTVGKSDSVLSWAGEGYDSQKLTVENFLKFYKRKYFTATLQDDYYVKANFASFYPGSFTIENLPFNNKNSWKKLKTPIKVLMPKDFIDERLNQFAETTMELWQYYQIETYNDKFVFKMTQNDFDSLAEKANDFQGPDNNSFASLLPFFRTVFKIFNDKLDPKIKSDTRVVNNSAAVVNINLAKSSKALIFQLLRKKHKDNYYNWLDVNFSYNSFAYSFFFKPNANETNTDKGDEFLQTIEFKVV
ncbi:lipoprotein [Spiroplasma sp. SV19]|uniref:lipoprotein n=1 Tax=Spiroplasma sp. SV19 TaxID=2570468 RepID=UPI0024B84A81|nr:lipoprotein [Spiroplasma sp. SV19]WHQ37254.1 hypothetical protein E7Y35_05135 [Spiroplasma sp. SV19]